MNDHLTPREAARLIGVTTETLREWTRRGLLHPHRTAAGHARYDPDELAALGRDRARRARPAEAEPRALPSLADWDWLPAHRVQRRGAQD